MYEEKWGGGGGGGGGEREKKEGKSKQKSPPTARPSRTRPRKVFFVLFFCMSFFHKLAFNKSDKLLVMRFWSCI